MNSIPTPAASAATAKPPIGAAVGGCPVNQASDGGALASHFAGTHQQALAKSPVPTGAPGSPAKRPTEQYGPLTTSRMDGAGGPHNRWDCEIAAAHRRNNPLLARRLQEARAKWNVAFEVIEPVWVPTDSQRVMLRLRGGAAANGLCTAEAA